MTERTGRCLCGAVSFRASDVDAEVGACHCRMCRRWTGGPFICATARDARFEGVGHVAVFASSDFAERAFCRRCGSGLYYRITDPAVGPGDHEIAVGLFDDTSWMRLTREIFHDRKPDLYALAGDRPRLTEAETLARHAAAIETSEPGKGD